MNIKKAVGFVSLVLASIVLVACSGKQDDNNTLTIGVMTKTASDQARWDKIEELLKKDKITLKYKEFTDYSQPNKARSAEHTSELQSRQYLVCRLLLEKKKATSTISYA